MAPVPSRILVVEDEPAINDIVATALRYEGHTVTQMHDGRDGLSEAKRAAYDLVVLDVMLPGLDGFEVCKRMRDHGVEAPVLFLTARDDAEDRVKGFTTGADDYVTKPFNVKELALRVAAIIRRHRGEEKVASNVLVFDDLMIDPATHEVRRAGHLIDLSPTEYRLLEYLVTNAGVVLSKAQILVEVWDEDFDGSENVVELYIGYLRRKIDDGHPPLIHTKRGRGYVFRVESA